MKILVTGASGFVGRRLCEQLKHKSTVRALVRSECRGPWEETVVADLATTTTLHEATVDVRTVFHLAGLAHDDAERSSDRMYRLVNVDGTARLLAAAAAAGVERLVFLSSVKAAGADTVVDPGAVESYGRSKREAERLVMGSSIPHRVVVRSSLVYGPAVKGNIERMIRAIERGVFPPVPDVGNRRSMIHIDDLVESLCLVAERSEANGKTYTVTDGHPYSTREIYVSICEALGKRVPGWVVPERVLRAAAYLGDGVARVLGRSPIDSVALDKLLGDAVYDSSPIESQLGFRPTRRFTDSIGEIVAARATIS